MPRNRDHFNLASHSFRQLDTNILAGFFAGWLGGAETPFTEVVKNAPEFVRVASPNPEAAKVPETRSESKLQAHSLPWPASHKWVAAHWVKEIREKTQIARARLTSSIQCIVALLF